MRNPNDKTCNARIVRANGYERCSLLNGHPGHCRPPDDPKPDAETKSQVLYAVWKYDLFPFYLCGKVARLLPKQRAEVEGYGGGLFNYSFLLVGDEGEAFKARLKELNDDYYDGLEKFKDRQVARVKALFNEHGVDL